MNDTRRAKKIITPSESTKRDLVSVLKFPPENIVVTPEGSEKKFRLHSQKEIEAIKQKYKLPDRYVLFVSRWERYKGLTALIEAYQLLIDKFPDLALVICGQPAPQSPEVAQLIYDKQAKGLNIITPGFVNDDDLAAIYSAASVYVHPSWYEGFGIMILEAFASGVPVVTSNISSLPEVVGEAGLLINPHKPSEIASATERILSQPKLAEELRRRGLERVKQFSWAKMAKLTHQVYMQVLSKS
jgi:glycosyltransferase involved in cell wall biosynthesis